MEYLPYLLNQLSLSNNAKIVELSIYQLANLLELKAQNDSVELPATLLNDYTFVPANNPANTRNGGVGLFYKNSLPVIVRNDLSFDESIVVELKFGRKKIFSRPKKKHSKCILLCFYDT